MNEHIRTCRYVKAHAQEWADLLEALGCDPGLLGVFDGKGQGWGRPGRGLYAYRLRRRCSLQNCNCVVVVFFLRILDSHAHAQTAVDG